METDYSAHIWDESIQKAKFCFVTYTVVGYYNLPDILFKHFFFFVFVLALSYYVVMASLCMVTI